MVQPRVNTPDPPFKQSINTPQVATFGPSAVPTGLRTAWFTCTVMSKVSKEQHPGAKWAIFTLIMTELPVATMPELVTFKVGEAASARGIAGMRRAVVEISSSAWKSLICSKLFDLFGRDTSDLIHKVFRFNNSWASSKDPCLYKDSVWLSRKA